MSARLEHCPECGAPWPPGPDYALRGMGWLQNLSRGISPTNGDVDIHDFHRNGRFLRFEVKSKREKWPPDKGQLWILKEIAKSPKWTVLILRGDARNVTAYPVTPDGIDEHGAVETHVEAIRRAVDAWLNGSLWRDASKMLSDDSDWLGHVCGWARVGGVWTCVQDHFATGFKPETACGATLPDYA